MKNKIIYSDNGTLSDITPKLSDYYSSTQAFSWVAAEDALYIGSSYPFTSKYFKVSSANVTAGILTVSYWDGATWRAMSDSVDKTGLSGTPFANSGYLEFTVDKLYPWTRDDTVIQSTTNITGLGDVTIYDLYWIKITASSNISMTLSWMGDVFCTDDDIGGLYPHLLDSTFIDDWESGKTDWEEQRVVATQAAIQYLKTINLNSEDLLLDKSELSLATAYWAVGLIFSAMGDGYADKVREVKEVAEKMLSGQSFTKDKDLNGIKGVNEGGLHFTRMVR